MRIIEYIFELKDNAIGKVVDIVDVMYWIGRLIGWVSIFALGYVGGQVLRGVLVFLGVL